MRRMEVSNIGLTVTRIYDLDGETMIIPSLDLSTMMPVLLRMLGIGGLRTYEKFKGVAREL